MTGEAYAHQLLVVGECSSAEPPRWEVNRFRKVFLSTLEAVFELREVFSCEFKYISGNDSS